MNLTSLRGAWTASSLSLTFQTMARVGFAETGASEAYTEVRMTKAFDYKEWRAPGWSYRVYRPTGGRRTG